MKEDFSSLQIKFNFCHLFNSITYTARNLAPVLNAYATAGRKQVQNSAVKGGDIFLRSWNLFVISLLSVSILCGRVAWLYWL